MLTHLQMQIDQVWIPVRAQAQELLEDTVRDQASSLIRSQVWVGFRDPVYSQVDVPTYILIRGALWEFVGEI